MNRFTNYFASVFHKISSFQCSTRTLNPSNQSRLNLECMDERCMPSVSPLTLGSTQELTNDSVIVSHENDLSKMTKMSKMEVAITLSPPSERKH